MRPEKKALRLRFGECTFDSETGDLLREGRAISLSTRAFQLLELLLSRRPRPIPKAELLRILWSDSGGSEASLAALVLELRGAIEQKGQKEPFLTSVGSEGYAFTGQAETDHRPTVRGGGYRYRLIWDDREIPLAEGENLIGRDYDALVRIDDAKVSRRHARITIEGESATVEDLRSTHGTLLNDEPVRRPSPLRNGDRIGIGAFLFVFRSHPV